MTISIRERNISDTGTSEEGVRTDDILVKAIQEASIKGLFHISVNGGGSLILTIGTVN